MNNSGGADKMLHSLESTNYLKTDKKNFVLFEFAKEKRTIAIMHQYT